MRLHLTFESIDMADGYFRDIDARDRRSAVLSMTLIAESASLSPSSLASSMVFLLGYLNNDDPTSHRVAPIERPVRAQRLAWFMAGQSRRRCDLLRFAEHPRCAGRSAEHEHVRVLGARPPSLILRQATIPRSMPSPRTSTHTASC